MLLCLPIIFPDLCKYPTHLIPSVSFFCDATLLLQQMIAEHFSPCLTADMELEIMWPPQEYKGIEEASKLSTYSY